MPSKGTIVHRGPGTQTVRGQTNLTTFDPIKENHVHRTSMTVRGRGRSSESLVGRGLDTVVISASSAPSPRIPNINPLAVSRTGVPSLPRRQYIPTVGEVPTT